MAITIDQFADRIKRAVQSGAIASAMGTAAAGLAMHGQRRAVHFASVEPGRPIGLGVVTGHLTDSLAGEAEPFRGGVDIILSTGGKSGYGAVPYAAVHELGLTVNVPAHKRTTLFGRTVAPFNVGPYSYKMPKRPFLQPAIEELETKADHVFSMALAKKLEALA
jgi:hypothetical protein